MTQYEIGFTPSLPWSFLAICAAVVALLCALLLVSRPKTYLLRVLAILAIFVAMFEPQILLQDRKGLKSIIAVVLDQSDSQTIGERQQQTLAAKEAITEKFGDLERFELRFTTYKNDIRHTDTDASTVLLQALASIVEDVPPTQIGGALLITDGQVHDATLAKLRDLGGNYPIHAIITGEKNEFDRKISIQSAPRFGLLGESQTISYMVEDTSSTKDVLTTNTARVTFRLNGKFLGQQTVESGVKNTFQFELETAGPSSLEIKVGAVEGELSTINNSAVVTVDGIRENLRVLLISGEPHAGERTWRSLLKSDLSVDLVHFTILRPLEKNDGTPIDELSLIAFPTRELFVEKIDSFDLIIFDRYKRRMVLPALYFDFIAQYVVRGGAVLMAAGPEFSKELSLANTALSQILPALPDGPVLTAPYRPQVSDLGLRHPISKQLDGANIGEQSASWGRWFRLISARQNSGDTLLTDEENSPVLTVDTVGEGRVALFLSDHSWLWARGFDGGGPYVQLLRRITHWLLKQPQMEAERLTANFKNGQLQITRQTLADTASEIAITKPDGAIIKVAAEKITDGEWQYIISQPQLGFWQINQDKLQTSIYIGPSNPKEFNSLVATADIIKPLADASGGAIFWAHDGIQKFNIVESGSRAYGKNWLGFFDTKQSEVIGTRALPLAQGIFALALLLLLFSAVWYREGK